MVAFRGMKPATAAERAHMARVKELPCCVCIAGKQVDPTEVHHIVEGNRRLGHFYVLPLCTYHHVRVYLLSQKKLWHKLMPTLGVTDVEWPVSKLVSRRVV
jgi:hypothetical protein